MVNIVKGKKSLSLQVKTQSRPRYE